MQPNAAVESDASWTWAKGSQHAKLVAAQELVKTALNKWHREYVCATDTVSIRKKYTTERVMAELNKFLAANAAIDKLAAISSMLRANEEILKS